MQIKTTRLIQDYVYVRIQECRYVGTETIVKYPTEVGKIVRGGV